jgi:arylsulfatase A-like enzyme
MERVLKIIGLLVSGLRCDHLSTYGNRWLRMVNFERLGRLGKVFTGARCACADVAAVRGELLTGLTSSRFADARVFSANYNPAMTLPAQLSQKGFQTVLLTDNYPLFPLYDQLNVFDRVCFIPGQGADPHLPEGAVPAAHDGTKKTKKIITGTGGEIPDREIQRFFRNEQNNQKSGRPTDRFFDTVQRFLNRLDEKHDWFVLLDSYGLTPPWNPPDDFKHFRINEDSNKIAWPMAGAVNPEDSSAARQINFLRRAYADQCLFLDAQVGKIESSIAEFVKVSDTIFFLLSDYGFLIGDDNFLLRPDAISSLQSDAVCQQAMFIAGGAVSAGGVVDGKVSAVDLFATLLSAAGVENAPKSDGGVIDLS